MRLPRILTAVILAVLAGLDAAAATINIHPQPIASDKGVAYDYDIVYVRSPRYGVGNDGKQRPARWAEFSNPFRVEAGTDLMLLHPDGSEELLVQGGAGSVQDPYVSFDGKWIFYAHFHKAGDGLNDKGADIYKLNLKTREIVQLTEQKFLSNQPGAKFPYGVYNLGPCPAPGGKIVFVSNRNGFLPPPPSYPRVALQLHVMDEDGSNVETIGQLNLGGALHPVILKDGRIIFASLENMGLRNDILWGIWSIHPDGTNWAPVVSAFSGFGAPSAFHFQAQLSDESVIIELYYNQNQKGFGTLFKLPPAPPPGVPGFAPGNIADPRNRFSFMGPDGKGKWQFNLPFTPYGMESLTPFIHTHDSPAPPSDPSDPTSPHIGKLTHPSGAPDNNLLVVWTLGPIGGSSGAVRDTMQPQPIDSGIYLMKGGQTLHEPGEMLLIKNDPNYNEQWPRAVVPYKRIYGIDEPKKWVHANDGIASPQLPEGTPFGLVGTSSLYKRESATFGTVPAGSTTSVYPRNYKEKDKGAVDAFSGTEWNWRGQGADAGRYDNSEIHAIRIVSFEPNAQTNAKGSHGGYPLYKNHAMERLRILGEIPVRKFADGKQPSDPDGNPDTSFLAKIPADVAFTFQTIDKDGMMLNMAQTWHQLRPGETRNNCGGCHAHSQKPTLFEETAAAKPAYSVFDLTERTPLLTAKAKDESGKKWDEQDEAGLKFQKGPLDVEYFRDVRPILKRSCDACHTKTWKKPAAALVLDDDDTQIAVPDGGGKLPGSYLRLAADVKAQFGPKPLLAVSQYHAWQQYLLTYNASRYICKMQARRSLLIWKVYGRRLDGWTNDEIPSEEVNPGDAKFATLQWNKQPLPDCEHHLLKGDIDYSGSEMPPAAAVAGTYEGPDGQKIKVEPLSDEDRRTLVRWVDLGCLIDLDFDKLGHGALADDTRPTLSVTYPATGANPELTRVLIGMYDYNSGLDMQTFQVTCDAELDGAAANSELAGKFKALKGNVWEWKFDQPLQALKRAKLIVSVHDRAGNVTRVERTFSVAKD